MKERTTLPTKKITNEDIDGLEYVKTEGLEQVFYTFWLRFIQERFTPCPDCQEKLHKTLTNSKYFYLGNKDYEPPVAFERGWDTIDEAWEEIERHTATEKDFIKIWGDIKGKKYWQDHLEIMRGE